MAYFETLGQLQNNDETFTEIYSKFNPSAGTITISNSTLSFQIDDILCISLSGGGYINGTTSITNLSVSGCDKLFQDLVYGLSGYHHSAIFFYIGKCTDNNISFSFMSSALYTSIFKVYRLVPR